MLCIRAYRHGHDCLGRGHVYLSGDWWRLLPNAGNVRLRRVRVGNVRHGSILNAFLRNHDRPAGSLDPQPSLTEIEMRQRPTLAEEGVCLECLSSRLQDQSLLRSLPLSVASVNDRDTTLRFRRRCLRRAWWRLWRS